MGMTISKMNRLEQLVQQRHIVRARDLEKIGVPRNYLGRLESRGVLQKVDRGLYEVVGLTPSEDMSLLAIAHKVPRSVICLLSALRFHGIGTQIPSEVWIAIDVKARSPRIEHPPIRVVRSSGESLRFGVQEHEVQGGRIRVYNPAKTVADCFKFRNKIGADVALEALRECLRQKKATVDELWRAAKVCRVANVMRPYMESLA
jgi:predicted transcriptional regulator of viral defense system